MSFKRKIIPLLILFFSIDISIVKAQNDFSYTDQIALKIPDSLISSTDGIAYYVSKNFSSETDQARAVFIILAKNISYDVHNFLHFDINLTIQNNNDSSLKFKKGICADYVYLYSDITNKLGIETHNISGYTMLKSRINHVPHAWCASKIGAKWYFVDPTWGAGYVENGQFYPKVNNDFFMVLPSQFIRTHMPFDPLWQSLNYPITREEFRKGKFKVNNKNKEYFNYSDTLEVYKRQSYVDQLKSECYRIQNSGIDNYLTYDILYHLKLKIENNFVDQFNLAFEHYKNATFRMNEFIEYSNDYFMPFTSEAEIRKTLSDIDQSIQEAYVVLNEIRDPPPSVIYHMNDLRKSLKLIANKLDENVSNLTTYLEISKKYRNSASTESEN